MTQLMCHQCGITPELVGGHHPGDYFTPTGNGNEIHCATCVLFNASADSRTPERARLTTLIVEARQNVRWWAEQNGARERENARLREYLDAAYEYAWSEVLMNVGPKTSAETRDDFLDAMTNWAVATGRQAPELDDTLGSEL